MKAFFLVMALVSWVDPDEPRPHQATKEDFYRAAAFLPTEPVRCPCGPEFMERDRRYREGLDEICAKSGAAKLAIELIRKTNDLREGPGLPQTEEHLQQARNEQVIELSFDVLRILRPEGGEEVIFGKVGLLIQRQRTHRIHKAFQALAAYRTALAGELLLKCLDMKTGSPRYSVVDALSICGRPEVAPKLADLLASSETAHFQGRVLEALARLGNSEVVPNLRAFVQALEKKDASHGRFKALMALFVLHRDEDTFLFVWERIGKDWVALSRDQMLHHLRPKVLPKHILDRALDMDSDTRLSTAYMSRVFGSCGGSKEARERWKARYERVGGNVAALLVDCLSDFDLYVKNEALRGLERYADLVSAQERNSIRGALKKAAATADKDWWYLSRCLYTFRDEETADILARLSEHSLSAATNLKQIDRKRGMAALRRFCDSGDRGTARLAAWNLALEKDDSGLAILFEYARSKRGQLAVNILSTIAGCLEVEFSKAEFHKDPEGTIAGLEAIWGVRKFP